MSDILRQALRKIKQDSTSQLVSEISEELVREQLFRQYINSHINYSQRINTVSELIDSDPRCVVDSINSRIDFLPPKQNVSYDGLVTNISHSAIEEQRCISVNNAIVYASGGLVHYPNGQYITDSVGPTHLASRRVSVALSMLGYTHGINHLRRALSSSSQDRDDVPTIENAIPVLPLWSNYFHWTVEALLKLHWKERYERERGTTPTILVPSQLSSWMRESLSLLGYDESDWMTVDTPRVRVESLVLPSQVEPIPEHVQWLRSRMLEAVDEPQRGARIYISRRNATKRRVRNERDVIDALRTHGFEAYVLEELSVKEQVELFADAEVVVGPHGAGFANLVYANDPLVVELFGRKRLNTYHRLSTALGFQYEPIYCAARGTDLVVDVDALLERVNGTL